jgi:hypothetical protein
MQPKPPCKPWYDELVDAIRLLEDWLQGSRVAVYFTMTWADGVKCQMPLPPRVPLPLLPQPQPPPGQGS